MLLARALKGRLTLLFGAREQRHDETLPWDYVMNVGSGLG